MVAAGSESPTVGGVGKCGGAVLFEASPGSDMRGAGEQVALGVDGDGFDNRLGVLVVSCRAGPASPARHPGQPVHAQDYGRSIRKP